MYFAIETKPNSTMITKIASRAGALAFVRRGFSPETEMYRMPKGWRSPNPLTAQIIIEQGCSLNIHFKR